MVCSCCLFGCGFGMLFAFLFCLCIVRFGCVWFAFVFGWRLISFGFMFVYLVRRRLVV